MPFPWPEAGATGVGSHPGESSSEAIRLAFGELSLPYLPELPARGVGADMVGRTASLLVDLAVAVEPSGWRFTDRPGGDMRRARDHLSRDLDALEEVALGYDGPLKIQVCGPWTLAASVELKHGDRALADAGAVRDLIASLAEGVSRHVTEVARRVPGATLLLQVDEPELRGVLTGTVPTASGFGRLAAVDPPDVEAGLAAVLAGEAFPLVHCCAAHAPIGLMRAAGARALSLDLSLPQDLDPIGEAVETGCGFFVGVVPGSDSALKAAEAVAAPVRSLWKRLGFAPERLPETVVLTPTCGLAGASPSYARAALVRCRESARFLLQDPEGG